MDMSNLEPNILFSQRRRWHGNNVSETLQTISGLRNVSFSFQAAYLKALLVLLLLLVNYTEAKVDLVGLFEIRLHAHDLRKRFFGMLQRSIAIVKNSNAVPKFWFLANLLVKKKITRTAFDYLWVSKVVQSLLIRRVCLLQVIHHQVAVAYSR